MKIVVMFDFDGTLLDTEKIILEKQISLTVKYFRVGEERARKILTETSGISFDKQLKKIIPNLTEEKIKKFLYGVWTKDILQNIYPKFSLKSGVRQTLDRLYKDGTVIILSTGSLTKVAKKILKRENIIEYFKIVFGSEYGTKFEHVKKIKNELKPDYIVFVGDGPYDVSLSKMLKIKNFSTVGLVGSITRRELVKSGADYVISDMRELKKIVNEIKNR